MAEQVGVAERVVVVGTYPPIPRPAAAATVAAVREAWAAGFEVTVVSPRVSAAHLAVPVAGPLAGRRLANVGRHTSARRLVLVIEPGMPVPTGPGWLRWVTAAGLARALRTFDHVTVVRVGDLDLPTELTAAADQVVDFPMAAPAPAGVTALGPPEVSPRERPRYLAGKVRRAVRARLGRL
jgi:hypothetical protein